MNITNKLQKIKAKYHYSFVLLRQLVITDFKLRYQGSLLGYLWSLLRPLAIFAILYIVFVDFLRLGHEVPHYAIYLLLGIVLWNYFAEVSNNGVSSIVGKGDLLRKLNFPRYVVVLSGSFSALINLLINLIVVGVFILLFGADPSPSAIFMVPLLIIELFVFAIAIAFILSTLFVRLRDINYIWEVIMQGAFYATPIIYPLSYIHNDLAVRLLMLSPIAQIIQDMRYVLVTTQEGTIGTLYDNELMRLVPIGIVLLLAVIGAYFFKKRSPYFAEDI